MKFFALVCLCLSLAASAACNSHDTSDALPLGSHKVSVRPRCISTHINNSATGDGRTYNLTCGDTRIVIKNEALYVNDKTYGMLRAGDAIHIEDTKVFVNSKEVKEQ